MVSNEVQVSKKWQRRLALWGAIGGLIAGAWGWLREQRTKSTMTTVAYQDMVEGVVAEQAALRRLVTQALSDGAAREEAFRKMARDQRIAWEQVQSTLREVQNQGGEDQDEMVRMMMEIDKKLGPTKKPRGGTNP